MIFKNIFLNKKQCLEKMKTSSSTVIKLCWFCEKKCYKFVSICSECEIKKRKKDITTKTTINDTKKIIDTNVQ